MDGHTHSNVLKDLQEAQHSDHDGREKAREADHFVNKRDGQWEPWILSLYANKPRYTIDLTSGIIAEVDGEMASMDFSIKVKPAGGAATNDIANHIDGLIRNIENNSGNGAKYIYRAAGKQMLTTGIGGWEVKQGYRDETCIDQDLIIGGISNFMDRVWFDPGAEERDMSDADQGFKLTSMSMRNYKKDFPKGSGMSVGRDLEGNVYEYKKSNAVIVGEHYYKKYESVTLVRMTDGSVYIADDKFDSVKDELADQGIRVDKERKTKVSRVYHQVFDGSDFLTDSTKTVFSYIPLIPVFGNFEISEDKLIYWGLVEKHMDPQRILNYVESRKVEEGALAPRAKKWMTPEQAAGFESTLETMNTNADPVQLYNHVPDQNPPFDTPGAQINQGLSETSANMQTYMQSISGRMNPSNQTHLGVQSGVALKRLENRANVSSYPYFTAMEVAIAHTCRVLGTAIPHVYDAQREVQLDQQDGNTKTITLNQSIFDQETGKIVQINDLSKGSYSYTCSSGPAFNNRQEETIAAITEIAAIDPSILQTGGDVFLANNSSPGMDVLAKRKRGQMLQQGLIPQEEWTDEEQAMMQQVQGQPQEPSAVEQAMIATAQAEQQKAVAMTADVESKTEERHQKIALEMDKAELENKKLALKNKEIELNNMLKRVESQSKLLNDLDNRLKTQAETLKTIKEATGADAIITPGTQVAYEEQTGRLVDTQLASQ